MTRYSVVIPTKSRPDTLRYVLPNVLACARDDMEVVVHQCGTDPATDQIVAAIRDPRLRYFAVPEPVPMRENWELALARARGDFVTVLGDDDGIVPGAFDVADHLIAQYSPELITWRPVTYFWPSCFDAAVAGQVLYRFHPDAGTIRFSSSYALRSLYRFRWHYSDMPMIYNSFVSRQVIERVRNRLGRYFLLNSPDITSGVVNAVHCDEFVWTHYPLSVAGISKNSTGHRIGAQEDPRVSANAIFEFMPQSIEQNWIPEMGNLDFEIAVELLKLRELLGLGAQGVDVDMADVAQYLAQRLQDYPGRLEASREALMAFCLRHRIDYASLASRFNLGAPPAERGFGSPISSETNVFGAARSVAAYLGPYRQRAASKVGFAPSEIALSTQPLEIHFSQQGNGPQFLERGWNKPEGFGVWASDYTATLSLPALRVTGPGERLRLEVIGRAPMVSPERRFCFSIGIESAGQVAVGEFNAESVAGATALEVGLDTLEANAPLRLTIRCLELVNPVLIAAGHDNRSLGYGLERLTLAVVPARSTQESGA